MNIWYMKLVNNNRDIYLYHQGALNHCVKNAHFIMLLQKYIPVASGGRLSDKSFIAHQQSKVITDIQGYFTINKKMDTY